MSNSMRLAVITRKIEECKRQMDHFQAHNDTNGARNAYRDLARLQEELRRIERTIEDEYDTMRNYRKRTSAWGNDADDFGNSFHDWS